MEFFNKNQIDECASVLKNGGILVFPTETVFGIGVASNSKENYDKLVEVKRRPPDKPFTLMCSSINQFKDIVEINDLTRKIIDKFMPGPLTLILKTKKDIPEYLDLGTGFVGIRVPDDDFVLKLINKVGYPLLVPSANKSGDAPAMNHHEAYEFFKNDDVKIVEGVCKDTIPSTVLKINGENVVVLRNGPISLEDIKEII